MRILFVTNHSYLPQRVGGSELSTNDLCIELVKKDNYCAVLAGLERGDWLWAKNRLIAKITSKKMAVDHILGYPVFRGWYPVDGAEEVVKSFEPDVVIVQAGQPIVMAKKFIDLGIKTIIYIRDVEFTKHGGDYFSHPLLSYIANSSYTAQVLFNTFELQAKVIPPLIQFNKYVVNTDRKKVLFINPVPEKGVELAFSLAEDNADIPFLFVESWALLPEIKELYLIRAKKAGNIEWLESQSDMKKVYSHAKLLLISSICNEAWGRVVTESQVSGIPVLGSNRGGLIESVGDGGILLDPEGEFQYWNEALRSLWFNDDIYQMYSLQALKHAQRQFIQTEFLLNEFIQFVKFFLR